MEVIGHGIDSRFDQSNSTAYQQTACHEVAHSESHAEMHDCETHCLGHSLTLLAVGLVTVYAGNYGDGASIVEIVYFNYTDR
jgi:hypothetical protein